MDHLFLIVVHSSVKMPPKWVVLFAELLWLFGIIFSHLIIIPERVNINYLNPKYVRCSKFNIQKYNRKSAYYLNLEGEILHTWTNNVSYEMIFYERLGNEYKRSFVEMRFKVCDMLQSDDLVGKALRDAGVPACPVPAAEYILHNMSVVRPNWRFKLPFERARIDSSLIITRTKEVVANWDMYIKAMTKPERTK